MPRLIEHFNKVDLHTKRQSEFRSQLARGYNHLQWPPIALMMDLWC